MAEPLTDTEPQERKLSELQLLDRAVRNIRGIEGNLRALDKIKEEFERRRADLEKERDALLSRHNSNGQERQTG